MMGVNLDDFLPIHIQTLGGFALIFSLVVLTVLALQISRPVHKRQWPRQEAFRMPPGPPGQFLWGNLYQFFRARDSGKLVPYVRPERPMNVRKTLRLCADDHADA